jgi:hypothetical protein
MRAGSNLELDFDTRKIIDAHTGIDIATFRVLPQEIKSTGRTILTGCQTSRPPEPPIVDRGVYFAGFPGVEAVWTEPGERSEILHATVAQVKNLKLPREITLRSSSFNAVRADNRSAPYP